MSLRILIVEDEHLGMERLARQLRSLGKDIEIAGLTDSVTDSVKWLKTNPAPDLILMDIDLGDGQSFEIFQQVPIKSHVIFTTSYDEQALSAFELNNIDYLLKPIRRLELGESINKYLSIPPGEERHNKGVEELVRSLKKQLSNIVRQRFIAREGNRLLSVETSQIVYFYSDEKGTWLRTADKKKFLVEHTLDEIESSVERLDYFRVNENWIIGADCVSRTQQTPDGTIILQLKPASEKLVLLDKDKIAAFGNWIKRKE